MIRRSPTRIELKLDDIQEFDYVQKYDKKKTAASADNGNLSASSASKLLRHERIGLHRPGTGPGARGLCMSSVCTSSSGNDTTSTTTTTQIQQQPSSSLGTGTTGTPATGVISTSTPATVDREGRSVSVEGSGHDNIEGTGNNNNTSTTTPTTATTTTTPNNNDGNHETSESTLDTLPSDIDTPETNDMDLIDFNSTYASANMSMDET